VGILYFALVSSLWWLALCLSVFDVRRSHPSAHLRVGDTHWTHVIGRICQMVYLRRSVHLIRKWHIPYHFIAWGLPLCAVIAGFAGTVRLPAPACSLTPARAELNLGLDLVISGRSGVRRSAGHPLVLPAGKRVVDMGSLLLSWYAPFPSLTPSATETESTDGPPSCAQWPSS
jgi:hypothetical protein